jgi:hypothetical protein
MPWSICTAVAPVTFHSNVDVPPADIWLGLALKATMTGGVVGVGAGAAVGKQAGTIRSNKATARIFFMLTSNSLIDFKYRRQKNRCQWLFGTKNLVHPHLPAAIIW